MGRRRTVWIQGMTAEKRRAYARAQYRKRHPIELNKQLNRRLDPFRTCRMCGWRFAKTSKNFYEYKPGYFSSYCLACDKVRSRKRRRDYLARAYFGISRAEYERYFENAKCPICFEDERKKMVLDHCHASKKIRGVLCTNCNSVLGFAEDNPEILQAAIDYLRAHQ